MERKYFKEDDQEEYDPADAVETAAILGGVAPIDFGRESDQNDYGETPETVEADRYRSDIPTE